MVERQRVRIATVGFCFSAAANPLKKTALNRKPYAEEGIMNNRHASTNWTRRTRLQLSTGASHAQAARPHDGGAGDEQLASPAPKTDHQARSAHNEKKTTMPALLRYCWPHTRSPLA